MCCAAQLLLSQLVAWRSPPPLLYITPAQPALPFPCKEPSADELQVRGESSNTPSVVSKSSLRLWRSGVSGGAGAGSGVGQPVLCPTWLIDRNTRTRGLHGCHGSYLLISLHLMCYYIFRIDSFIYSTFLHSRSLGNLDIPYETYNRVLIYHGSLLGQNPAFPVIRFRKNQTSSRCSPEDTGLGKAATIKMTQIDRGRSCRPTQDDKLSTTGVSRGRQCW